MHRLRFILALLLGVFVLGCAKKNGNEESVYISRILFSEAKLSKAYFSSGNRDVAEAGLRDYLNFLDVISADRKMTPAEAKAFHSGKSLALARLNILLAQKDSRPIDLEDAVREWRTAALLDGENLDDSQIRFLLVNSIRQDEKDAPWLFDYDQMVKDIDTRKK